MWRILRGRRRERDLAEELEAHIEIEIRQLMDGGLGRDQAEAEARRRFGSRALVAELTRDAWRPGWLAGAWQDLRYAARALRHNPAFSAAAVLSLALGIGAATVVFSVADTVYLRPLAYAAPHELMFVAMRLFGMDFVMSPDSAKWRRDNTVFQEMAAMQYHGGRLATLGTPSPGEVRTTRVSYNFVTALGTRPALGRNFQPQDELPNAPGTALITDRLWRNQFQARRDIAGETIVMDGLPYRVIGVLPPSFMMPMEVPSDILTPLPVPPNASHHDREMATWTVIARLKPGVTQAQALANLQTLFAASKAAAPEIFRNDTAVMIEPLQQRMAGNARTLVLVLAGAVGCLLLIACANVANLLLARWAARSRELAVRAAIGAGRARLVRQLIAETAVLCAAAWALGMALVMLGLRGFVYFAAGSLPRLNEAAPDARVFGIAIGVSALTMLLFGVLPALRAGRVDVQTVLQQAAKPGMSSGHRTVRRLLVTVEVALSVVLLTGAALLAETLWRMQHDRLGFEPEHVMSISIPLKGAKAVRSSRQAITEEMLAHIRRLPGTIAASWAECTPLTVGPSATVFTRSDQPLPKSWDRGDTVAGCSVGPEYFQAAGMRLVRGREFSAADYDHPGTLEIVNEALARRYFPGEDPIGRQIDGRRNGGWKTVIGVVKDSKNQGLNQPPAPQMFINDLVLYAGSDAAFVVRYAGDERMLIAAVRARLREIDPGMLAKFETLDDAIGRMSAPSRFNGVLVGSFAAVALVMALIGVYGVLTFAVARRTQEIGIRVALGAGPWRVQGMVLREGLLLVAAGLAIGLGGALVAARYLKTLLYGVTATDPRTYTAVEVLIAAAAMIAVWLPSRRAASVDPAVALRRE
jgi:putative ABC transport system permease protein